MKHPHSLVRDMIGHNMICPRCGEDTEVSADGKCSCQRSDEGNKFGKKTRAGQWKRPAEALNKRGKDWLNGRL